VNSNTVFKSRVAKSGIVTTNLQMTHFSLQK
jgi:hypothetical protein